MAMFGLADIQEALNFNHSNLNWILVAYMLTFATILPVGGPTGRPHGFVSHFPHWHFHVVLDEYSHILDPRSKWVACWLSLGRRWSCLNRVSFFRYVSGYPGFELD